MGDLSVNGADRLLTWMMTSDSVTRPANLHAALFTAPAQEVAGAGYVRQPIAFAPATNRSTSNTTVASFTASGADFGLVTHMGLFDAPTDGNLLLQGPLTGGGKMVENGDTLVMQVDAVSVTLN